MFEANSSVPAQSALQQVKPAYQRWRLIKDALAGYGVVAGGLGVIVAIVLIFFYLLYVVFPLFIDAEAEQAAQYTVPEVALGKTVLIAAEEQNEIGVRFTASGQVVFFNVKDGSTLTIESIAIPEQVDITSFAHGSLEKGLVAYGLSDGRIVVARHTYKTTFPNDIRVITPGLEYPLGKEPLQIDRDKRALSGIALRIGDEQTTVVARTIDGRLLLTNFSQEESLFDDEPRLNRVDTELTIESEGIEIMMLDKEQRNLYLASAAGRLSHLDISDKEAPAFKSRLNVLAKGEAITAIEFLNGELSLLIGDSAGKVSQWSLFRNEKNQSVLQKMRAFKVSDQAIVNISPEQRRKGFMVADAGGKVAIYHTTAERQLVREQISPLPPIALSLTPRANAFLLQTQDEKLHVWHVDNQHPEVSMSAIWQKVWYESYPKPDYIWQSSSASNDFEPKMSLTPLVFGTLKAAFYAMLMAIPLALMGAIYTAYFMAPKMRQMVKPTIEIMEALPTVILGFLAGLWLAPFVEENLVGIFALLMLVPSGVILFAYVWQFVPKSVRHRIPEGWDAAVLMPVIVLSAWLAFLLGPGIESLLFDGNMRIWMRDEFGIGYDQRNALVVGLAMGFAVIPTIFSIAEDAVFSVPKHLTTGSLALGATPWQTMVKVVLLTASPGIFSAIMIGFGRAVGETMIVLMATGNTPLMDLSIFQGMRTLSANIAVEMPESAVDSTHYRVLFLAALVLFMFTFVFNTLAELIRQNLRKKYSSL